MDRLDFGKELIKIRKAKGLTQTEVADKCNITLRTIQRIESGAVKPRSSNIKIISEALGLNFFEHSNQNSNFNNRTILWYLKDLFNFKTNAMKKISILSVFILITTILCLNIFNTEAQSKHSGKKQKTDLKNQGNKVDFSNEYDAFEIDGDFVWTLKVNKHGLTNLEGKIIIPNEYDAFEVDGNFIWTLKNNKHGLMNLEGKIIIPNEYDAFEVDGNFVATLKNNKRGLMNLDGETIIPCEYDTLKLKNGVAILSKKGITKRIRI